MTPSGIEPATFRFVAQHLNHCATMVPIMKDIYQLTKHTAEDSGLLECDALLTGKQ